MLNFEAELFVGRLNKVVNFCKKSNRYYEITWQDLTLHSLCAQAGAAKLRRGFTDVWKAAIVGREGAVVTASGPVGAAAALEGQGNGQNDDGRDTGGGVE